MKAANPAERVENWTGYQHEVAYNAMVLAAMLARMKPDLDVVNELNQDRILAWAEEFEAMYRHWEHSWKIDSTYEHKGPISFASGLLVAFDEFLKMKLVSERMEK